MRLPTVTARAAWTVLIAGVLLYTLAAIARDPLRINHDCALYLEAGLQLLDGRLPYVGVVDTNPPLILYLSTLPAAISRGLSVHPIPTFLVGVWALTVVSTFATRRVLAVTCPPHESILVDLVALAIAVSSLLVLRDNFFGQREHLFILGYFPHLAFRFRHWEGARSPKLPACAAGLLAGLFACLKPHFVAIALAPELYWLATRRRTGTLLRPELVAFVSVGLAYAAHFLLLPEAVRVAFFERWLPLVAGAYHVYDLPVRQILRTWPMFWQMTIASVLVLFTRPRRVEVGWRLATPLVVLIVTAMAMFLVQQKGFRYQGLPIAVSSIVLLALFIGHVTTRLLAVPAESEDAPPAAFSLRGGQAGPLAIATCLAVAGVVVATRGAAVPASIPVSRQPIARAIVDASGDGDPVLVISSSVPHSYPTLVQLGRRPGSRFLFCFPIPLLYDGIVGTPGHPFPYRGTEGAEAPTEEEEAFLADLAADVKTMKPKAILIDTGGCQGCPSGFDIHDYLDRTAFLTTALARYRRVGLVDELALYLPAAEAEQETGRRHRLRRRRGQNRSRPR